MVWILIINLVFGRVMVNWKDTTRELRNMLRERLKKQATGDRWANPINAIGTTITGAVSDLSQTFVERSGGLTNGDINKLLRAKVLLDRLGGPAIGRATGLPRDSAKTNSRYNPNNYDVRSSLSPTVNKVLKNNRRQAFKNTVQLPGAEIDITPTKVVTVGRATSEGRLLHDNIRQHKRNDVIIFNLNNSDNGYQYIILQNRPPEIEFSGETSWASIKSFGRNLPMYHFTGAEDKIQFNISWYCDWNTEAGDTPQPWQVIQKCRLLEAWSKANGYSAAPPLLQIDWGGSGLFSNAYFILQSATYRLNNFRDGYIDRRNKDGKWVDGKLYPMAATQELIFARVSSENLDYKSYYDEAKLSGIKGIGYSSDAPNEVKGTNIQDSNSLWQA